MTHEEILQGLYDNTLVGNAPEVKDLVNQGLEDELGPESMLYDALIPSLEEVGARFERGDYFVPEMLIAARAMQGALDINALQKAGIRDNVIVMVGGAPVTQEYADAVGADGYAADASTAVRLAKDLIEKRRSAVPA
jgi:methanogenic corrinoid protein MtbC1